MGALAGVTDVTGTLSIRECDSLASVDGLDALVSIGYMLDISDNGALRNLAGLGAVTTVAGDLYIQDNVVLSQADVDTFVARLGSGLHGAAATSGNGP
jgi:hypothetical protein